MNLTIVVSGINRETNERMSVPVSLPINSNDLLEMTGIDANSKEIEIINHEFPFSIKDMMWLHELNKIAITILGLEADPRLKSIKSIADEWHGSNGVEALYNLGEIRYLKDVDDYNGLAQAFVGRFKTGTYISPFMRQFFDIGAYASFLSSQGGYVFSNGNVFYKSQKVKEIQG